MLAEQREGRGNEQHPHKGGIDQHGEGESEPEFQGGRGAAGRGAREYDHQQFGGEPPGADGRRFETLA